MNETIRDPSGREWKAGCLPRATKPGDNPRLRVMGTDGTPPPVDPNAPDVIDPELFVEFIINQKQQGSCCGCAGIQALTIGRAILGGLKSILLAQSSLYGPGNGNRDQGMAIDTCLELLMTQGACPASLIDPFDWQGYWNGTWPDNWRTVGQGLLVVEAFDCMTMDHVRSCYKRAHPVVYGAKGHAVVRIGDNLDVNSWGRGWKNNGLGQWVDERTLASEIKRYGAWGLRVAIDPANDGDLPQPQKG